MIERSICTIIRRSDVRLCIGISCYQRMELFYIVLQDDELHLYIHLAEIKSIVLFLGVVNAGSSLAAVQYLEVLYKL